MILIVVSERRSLERRKGKGSAAEFWLSRQGFRLLPLNALWDWDWDWVFVSCKGTRYFHLVGNIAEKVGRKEVRIL